MPAALFFPNTVMLLTTLALFLSALCIGALAQSKEMLLMISSTLPRFLDPSRLLIVVVVVN
jgi:hypothetical protein